MADTPSKRSTRQVVTGILGCVFFLVVAGAAVAFVAPGIRDDLAVREAARPAPAARVTEGRCRARLMLLQDCSVTLSWPGVNGAPRQLSYLFVEPHSGNWTVRPMSDPKRPDLVTTDLGLDRLNNRIATLAGMVLVSLLLAGGGLLSALRRPRA